MVIVQVVLSIGEETMNADINLLKREDATAQEWEWAKAIEGVLLEVGKAAAQEADVELATTIIPDLTATTTPDVPLS